MKPTLSLYTTLLTLLLAWTVGSGARAAKTPIDSTHQRLWAQFMELYATDGQEEQFYQTSDLLKQYFLDHDDLEAYYKIRMNECLYDVNHNQPYRAIQKANKMLDDMKTQRFERLYMVYSSLGTIYQSRGNYKMAEHYFLESQRNLVPTDTGSVMGVYSRLAFLQMLNKPLEARQWNKRYEQLSLTHPPYHQVYLFIDAAINFTLADRQAFRQSRQAYYDYRRQHPQLDNYGLNSIELMSAAFDGKYDQALSLLNDEGEDLDPVARQDVTMLIYQMMGKPEKALQASRRRAEIVDSLNTDMLFDNINQINADMNVAKMKREAARNREALLTIIIVLAAVVIVILSVWLFVRRKLRQHLIEKNRQLEEALAMAEESDRMKTEFVRQVTHEIRTPLNAISGFNQILNATDIELSADERTDIVNRIKENTQAITNIVDELLNVSEKESSIYYTDKQDLNVNQLLSALVVKNREQMHAGLEMHFSSSLPQTLTIHSNQAGITKIIDHLLHNAIKFTLAGTITVSAQAAGRQLEVSVTDTGRGIAKEVQDRIFEQFFKEDHFMQGIGLGLTVSKKIAQRLGGDLVLDTTYTNGARFVLTLPIV